MEEDSKIEDDEFLSNFKTNNDKMNYINQINGQTVSNAQNLRKQDNLSIDSFNKSVEIMQSSNENRNEANSIFKSKTRDDPGYKDDLTNDLDEMIQKAIELFGLSRDAMIVSQEKQDFQEKALEVIQSDKDSFVLARDFHRKQAGFFSRLVVASSLLTIVLIGFLFIWNPVSVPQEVTSAFQDGQNYTVWIISIAIQLAARLSVFALIGWLVAFFAKMHARHVEQAVIYEDRLAGISTAEVMLQKGTVETVEKTLGQMTENYLNLNNNAFKKVTINKGEVYTVGQLNEIAKVVQKFFPKSE